VSCYHPVVSCAPIYRQITTLSILICRLSITFCRHQPCAVTDPARTPAATTATGHLDWRRPPLSPLEPRCGTLLSLCLLPLGASDHMVTGGAAIGAGSLSPAHERPRARATAAREGGVGAGIGSQSNPERYGRAVARG
jgi:hypothetical protein